MTRERCTRGEVQWRYQFGVLSREGEPSRPFEINKKKESRCYEKKKKDTTKSGDDREHGTDAEERLVPIY